MQKVTKQEFYAAIDNYEEDNKEKVDVDSCFLTTPPSLMYYQPEHINGTAQKWLGQASEDGYHLDESLLPVDFKQAHLRELKKVKAWRDEYNKLEKTWAKRWVEKINCKEVVKIA